MIALLQRVTQASVQVSGEVIGKAGHGLMILVCAEKGDTDEICDKLAAKTLAYRIFEDENGKMNRSVSAIGGDILVVSQFTLAADTSKGLPAAAPQEGERLYNRFVDKLRESGLSVQTGQFGAYMQVSLVNDGPVTIWLKA